MYLEISSKGKFSWVSCSSSVSLRSVKSTVCTKIKNSKPAYRWILSWSRVDLFDKIIFRDQLHKVIFVMSRPLNKENYLFDIRACLRERQNPVSTRPLLSVVTTLFKSKRQIINIVIVFNQFHCVCMSMHFVSEKYRSIWVTTSSSGMFNRQDILTSTLKCSGFFY